MRPAQAVTLACLSIMIAGGPSGQAAAQAGEGPPMLVPYLKLTEEDATARGLVAKNFAIGPASISFRTFVPADAKVETIELPGAENPPEGGVGKITIVGKVALAGADTPIETTVAAVHLASPAAASRVCDWGVGISGYETMDAVASDDLATAQSIGSKGEKGRRTGGGLIACYTRGDVVVTVLTNFDLSGAGTKEEVARIVDRTRDYSSVFLSNLIFANGLPAGYGTASMTAVDVAFGDDRLSFSVPKLLQVRINDFSGPLPAEMHLLQEKAGKSHAAIFLGVQERDEPADLGRLGAELVEQYFLQQSGDVKAINRTFAEEDPSFKSKGIASRSYRFDVVRKDGGYGGDIIAAVYWRGGRLYLVSMWSAVSPSQGGDAFFSRLPALTGLDLIRQRLLDHISKRS